MTKSPDGKRSAMLLLRRGQADKATDAYRAAQTATEEKTARLRALRLAKEADEAASRTTVRRPKVGRS
jgi:hypothetical protein